MEPNIDYKLLGEASSDLIVVFDAQFRYTYVNPQVERVMGSSPETLLGRTVWEAYPRTEGTVYAENYQRAMRERVVVEFEAYYAPRNTWNRVRCVPEPSGGLIVFARDTTDEHLAEAAREEALYALRTSEREARRAVRLLDSISDAFLTLDKEYRITYVNAEAARINKKPAEAFLGRLHWDEWPASIGTEFEKQFRRAMTERVTVHFLERYYVPEQYDQWIDISVYPASNEDGGGIYMVYRDVTAAKKQEEALAQSESQLRDVRTRLEASLMAGDIATWTWDLVEDRLVADDRLAHLFSISPEDAKGARAALYFEAMHPEDRPLVADAITRAIEETNYYGVEYRVVLPDGSHRWLQSRGRVERDRDGKAVSLPGVAVDITEQVEKNRREQFLAELTVRTRGLLDPEEVLYQVAKAVGEYTNANRALYIEIDDDADTLTIRRDFVQGGAVESIAGTYPLDAFGPPIIQSLRAGNITQSDDTEADPRLAPEHRATFRATNFRAFLGVPLHKAGQWVAILALHQATPRTWTAEEAELLTLVVERTWLAVENARLFRETQRQAEHEALLNQIGAAVRAASEPEAILQSAVSILGQGLRADRCYFVRYDQIRDTARVLHEWMRPDVETEPLSGRVFQMSSFAVDRDAAYKAGQTHVMEDVTTQKPEDTPVLTALQLRALVRVPIEVGDQMTALSVAMASLPRRWTSDEVQLVENVAALVRSALELAYVRLREHNIAQQLQDALQPPAPPPLSGLALAAFYRPALSEAGVGGDFHDVFGVEKGCTALVVADLSGKGLAAASQVATVRNMLRFALYTGQTVSQAVNSLHHALVEHDLLTGFATLFVGMYDHSQRTVTYVNCGQEPALVWRAATGKIEPLDATGPVLGGFAAIAGSEFEQKTITLFNGDVLALFTDGLTEVGASRKELLEVEGVSRLLRECCADVKPWGDPQAIVDGLIAHVDAFARGGVRDDIALLVGIAYPPRFEGSAHG